MGDLLLKQQFLSQKQSVALQKNSAHSGTVKIKGARVQDWGHNVTKTRPSKQGKQNTFTLLIPGYLNNNSKIFNIFTCNANFSVDQLRENKGENVISLVDIYHVTAVQPLQATSSSAYVLGISGLDTNVNTKMVSFTPQYKAYKGKLGLPSSYGVKDFVRSHNMYG